MKVFSLFGCAVLALSLAGCAALINGGTNGMHVHNWGQEVPGKSFAYYDELGQLHLLDFGSEQCNKGEMQDVNVRSSMFTKKYDYPMATSTLRECILVNGKDSVLAKQKYSINQDRFMIIGSRDTFLLEPNKDEKGYVVGAYKVLIRKSTGKGYPLSDGFDCGSAVAHLEKKYAADKALWSIMNKPYRCGGCNGTGRSNKCLQCNGVGFSSEKYTKMGSFSMSVNKGVMTTTSTKSQTVTSFPDCKACVGGQADSHNCTVCKGTGCISCEHDDLNKANGIVPKIPEKE